jgi:hypothetical protein
MSKNVLPTGAPRVNLAIGRPARATLSALTDEVLARWPADATAGLVVAHLITEAAEDPARLCASYRRAHKLPAAEPAEESA